MVMGRTNEDLIELLKKSSVLKNKKLEEAMRNMKREWFIPKKHRKFAYANEPLPIGQGQTISQPAVVVHMTEWLDLKRSDKVLEIGTGSGWQSALISHMAKRVYSIEAKQELADIARRNLKRAGVKNVEVIVGDGSEGYPGKSPYDKIICTAAAPEILHTWKEQLKEGGRIVAPIGRFSQVMTLVEKRNKKLNTIKKEGMYRFVPLIGKYGFKE